MPPRFGRVTRPVAENTTTPTPIGRGVVFAVPPIFADCVRDTLPTREAASFRGYRPDRPASGDVIDAPPWRETQGGVAGLMAPSSLTSFVLFAPGSNVRRLGARVASGERRGQREDTSQQASGRRPTRLPQGVQAFAKPWLHGARRLQALDRGIHVRDNRLAEEPVDDRRART